MDRAMLEKPFAADQIRTRRGGFGEKPLAYVAGHEYVRRLNEVLDAEWSFEVVEYRILDAEVVVLGKLVAGAVQKAAFGGSAITRNRDTGEVVSLADDLKAAATDALKKACSLLGIGLHLYAGDDKLPTRPAKAAPTPQGPANPTPTAQPQPQPQEASQPRGERLTSRQLGAIWNMSRKLGLGADAVRQRAVELFGTPPEQLARADASALISRLGDEIGRRSAA